jgi:protein phosphatase
VAVAVLAVLVAGGIGTYAWALGHWFVGVQDGAETQQVTVFRGLNVSILGLDLYRVDEVTDLFAADLRQDVRKRVQNGITADDAAEAERIVDTLRDELLPLCPEDEGTDSAGDQGTTATTAPTPPPTGETTIPPGTGGTTTPSAPSETSSATGRATKSSEPGVDCREER